VEWRLAVDLSPEVLEICRKEGAVRGSARFEDALADDIDVVDVSTPNHLHEEHAVRALEAGKHVLLQKPMAHNVASADRILAAAAKSKGTLGMYMVMYTYPVVWEIKRMIEAGRLGKIQSVRARDAHRGGLKLPKAAENWRGSRELTGGGSFVQLSVHSMNLVQWWVGEAITEVKAFSEKQFCENVGGDDVTVACVKFGEGDNAVLGMFDSGYASDGRSRELFGTKGYVRFINENEVEMQLDDAWEGELLNYTNVGTLQRFSVVPPDTNDVSNPFNQNRMFLEAVGKGERVYMSGEKGRWDLAVCAAVYRSAEEGRAVRVE
jgi:predicted dehydrogenase